MMTGRIAFFVCIWLASLCQPVLSDVPDRFAFIVGNKYYERSDDGNAITNSIFNLDTPERDAMRYADVLSSLGWRILNDNTTNLTAKGMHNALDQAVKQISSGSEILFIFNGHGFSEGDNNYLVGVSENGDRYSSTADMRDGSVELKEVIEQFSKSDPSRIIIIVNACSDEPLISDASMAPVKPEFADPTQEILVLYSSSPGGIAYDVLGNYERDQPSTYSAFSRAFIPLLEQDRPLLSIFADTRIEVERLSKIGAASKQRTGRNWLQIPHVLFDTINGQFSIANVAKTAIDVPPDANWRTKAEICRVNEDQLAEALNVRDLIGDSSDDEIQSAKACIIEAAEADLGIEKIGYDEDARGVVVQQSSPGKLLRIDDVIRTVKVVDPNRKVTTHAIDSIKVFRDILAENHFANGWMLSIYRGRLVDGELDFNFERRVFQ